VGDQDWRLTYTKIDFDASNDTIAHHSVVSMAHVNIEHVWLCEECPTRPKNPKNEPRCVDLFGLVEVGTCDRDPCGTRPNPFNPEMISFRMDQNTIISIMYGALRYCFLRTLSNNVWSTSSFTA
jgi:hypothetical protein